MNDCTECNEISNTFDVLFNEDEHQVNTEKLCVMQRNDEQLKVLFIEISAFNEGQVHSCNYSIHKIGLLIHSMHDRLRDDTDENLIKQIVIPFYLPKKILYLAHEFPVAGHLGMNNTLKHMCEYLYGPKVSEDVEKFCKSFDVC